MFRSYLTVAFRHLNRQKGYAFINVMSLSLGIACALLILLYHPRRTQLRPVP